MRILTTLRVANHGSILFADSLQGTLANAFPNYDIRYLDYTPRNRAYYEILRMLKPHRKSPFFNLKRYFNLENFINQNIPYEKIIWQPLGYDRMINFLATRNYDALVVSMVVWDIHHKIYLSNFPNAYWLSEKIPTPKIAYAVSGHRSKVSLVKQYYPQIKRILDSYALIGVRDDYTWEIVTESGVAQNVPVIRMPDPTFLYENKPTQLRKILVAQGVDLQRPILGLAVYGKPFFSKELYNFYHRKGFQIISLSMYNPYADLNLGQILNPYEWAEVFCYLSFCITDRFHGTIYCLRANKPFISIEPYPPENLKNSKIYCLLKDFDLTEFYADTYRDDFKMPDFLARAEELRASWNSDTQRKVDIKVQEMRQRNLDFIERMKDIL
jgi:hypothetical protein